MSPTHATGLVEGSGALNPSPEELLVLPLPLPLTVKTVSATSLSEPSETLEAKLDSSSKIGPSFSLCPGCPAGFPPSASSDFAGQAAAPFVPKVVTAVVVSGTSTIVENSTELAKAEASRYSGPAGVVA